MELKKLGNTEVYISPVAFGAWAIGGWMWGGTERKEAIEAISKSIELGITTIDTAPAYGFGLSEEITGEAIAGKRDKVQILTKFGLTWGGSRGKLFMNTKDNQGNDITIYHNATKEVVIRDCEESLKRLKTDYLDLFQIHWPDPATPVEETMEALEILFKQGKILAGGVCNYDAKLLDSARKTFELASDQVPYSMLRRDIEKELVPYCIANNTGIIAYSPLQRGVLTGKFKPGHKFSDGDTRAGLPWYKKENIERINNFLSDIKPIADEKKASITQLVLRWTLQQPGINCILAGARNPEQVVDNAGTMHFRLTEEEINFINEKLDMLIVEIS